MRRLTLAALLLAATALAGACDNTLEDLPTAPTPPPTTTEEFTGSININGAATHTFIISASGAVTATLSEVTPDATIAVGLNLGTWNGVNCKVEITSDNALQGNTITGTVTGVGTLCVYIHDNGKLVEPINYKVTVVHP